MTVSKRLSKEVAIAAGFLALVSACGAQTPTESSTAAPLPVTVQSIVDGRTVVLSNGVTVVVQGLAQPGECWAASSAEFATTTLVGKSAQVVVLSLPVQEMTSSLLLADGTNYAVLAAGQGVARAITGADTAIQAAETAAEQAKLGFWGPPCGGRDVKARPARSS